MRRRTRRRGQTLVEAAVVLIFILLPISMGILQFGIVLNATNSLTQIAREGARYAAMRATDADYPDSVIKAYTRTVATGTSINPVDLPDSTIVISMIDDKPRVSGNAIRVVITYPMSKKLFVGQELFRTTVLGANYTAESTFIVE